MISYLARILTASVLLAVVCLGQDQPLKITTGFPVSPKTEAAAQASIPPSVAVNKQVTVMATGQWLDTGVNVNPGDRVVISGEGSVKSAQGAAVTPVGMARSWRDLVRSLPVNNAGSGALIGRIGSSSAVVPFLIGEKKEFVATRPGRLFLGVNLGPNESLDGSFRATIQLTPPDKAAAQQVAELKFDDKLFAQIPRRVTDKAGGLGDMVNFLMIGSVDDVKSAFVSSGWVQVDKTVEQALLNAVLKSTQKTTYLEMPMSELYLFGRPQDFGFARAEPVKVVEQRHHLRIWKAPFQVNGRDVWIGAATHDLGFEKDQRNNSVTHKIDPNVDDEREFVKASLTEGGGVIADTYVTPKDPVREAKTATGGSFHSDGRVLILQLRSSAPATNLAGH